MHAVIVETVLSNLWVACLLAVFVHLLSRWVHRPALIHALWIVVLAKLVMPPLWAVEFTADVPAGLSYVVPQRAEGTPHFTPSSWFPRADKVPEPRRPREPEENRPNVAMTPMAVMTAESQETSSNRIAAPFLAIAEFFFGDRMREAAPAAVAPTAGPAPPRRPNVASRAKPNGKAALEPWQFVSRRLVLVFWLAGSLGCVGWGTCRIVRFAALLRLSEPAPLWLHQETERLAAQIHLDRLPHVWLVPGPVSPMLWSVGQTSRLLFPRDLLLTLDADARQTLLLHELVHLRRRDHMVRLLESLATALYWWHPLIWWARREVHVSEEACCDAWVVSQLPQRRRTYAEAILRTVDFLADYRCALPPAASGLGGQRLLRDRLTQIMQGRTPRDLPRGGRWLVIAAAIVSLPFLPTIVEAERSSRSRTVVSSGSEGTRSEIGPETLPADDGGLPQLSTEETTGASSSEVQNRTGVFPALHFNVLAALRAADGNAVLAFAVSRDGAWAAAASYEGSVDVWSLEKGTLVASLASPARRTHALAFSQDAASLLLSQEPGLLSVWDWRRDEQPRMLPSAHGRSITAVAFAPVGPLLATCGKDRRICLWDLDSQRLLRSVVAHDSAVRCVCWSPDGAHLASGGDDGRVRLWSASSLALVRSWKGHSAAVRCVRFAPSRGGLLASADEHGAVQCWNSTTGAPGPELAPHGDMIWTLAFSPDGSLLATGGFDGRLVIRDLSMRRPPTRIQAAESVISGLAFDGEGTFLAASYDGSIRRCSRDLFPLNRAGGLGADVVDDAVDAADGVGDPRADPLEYIVR